MQSPWFLSNKCRNRLLHAMNGNAAQGRTTWESTAEKQGIQLNSPDELVFPGDASARAVRADEVCNGAEGYAMCNQVFLDPKLHVVGGSYLLLIVPGVLGQDLRNQLNSASVNLIGKCFSTTLTCMDPYTKKIFPRTCVCINLGLQNVSSAELKPQVAIEEDDCKTVCVSCFGKYNVEAWDMISRSSYKEVRIAVIDKVKQITKLPTLELWGLSVNTDKRLMTCFVRVTKQNAKKLTDSKDAMFFFRPFVSPACPPEKETDVFIVWSTKITTLAELITVTNTLKGVEGYVANQQSLGIRVAKQFIAAARQALQHPTVQYTQSNLNVAGMLRFVGRGFPPQMSAQTIVKCLASPTEASDWKAWNVIPFKSAVQGSTRTWFFKADVEPSHDRLILPGGFKITLCAEPTANESFQQKVSEQALRNEQAKQLRRQKILQEQSTATESDPWKQWNEQKQSKGKGKRKSHVPPPSAPSAPMAEPSQVEALQKEVERLNRRINAQDGRLDTIESNMSTQHQEIMMALRSLGASSSAAAPPTTRRKREPELPNTPLRALADGDSNKSQKGKGSK